MGARAAGGDEIDEGVCAARPQRRSRPTRRATGVIGGAGQLFGPGLEGLDERGALLGRQATEEMHRPDLVIEVADLALGPAVVGRVKVSRPTGAQLTDKPFDLANRPAPGKTQQRCLVLTLLGPRDLAHLTVG